MTGRYVRKSVNLEIRAAQKVASWYQQPQHNVPLPEAADEDQLPDYITSINQAVHSYNAGSTPSSSGWSSPVNMGASLVVSQGGWTTGNTTDRSTSGDSSYSLDEFEKQAASTMNRHFEEFESMLFEGPKETGSRVYQECQEWLTQFPHLRVLGQQLIAPTDVGYNFVASSSSASTPRPSTTETLELSSTDQSLSTGSDIQGLTLSGRKVKATVPPVPSGQVSLQGQDPSQKSSNSSNEFDFLYEEIIAQDGIYEDIIAVDYKDIYEDNMENKKQITPRRRHVGYPPISPNACVKDSVLSGAFDQMWSEISTWLRPLLKRYSQEVESKKSVSTLEHVMVPQRPVRASSFILTPRDAQEEMLPLLQVCKMALRDRNSNSMSSGDMAESGILGESTQAPFIPMPQMAVPRPSTMHQHRRRLSYSQHLDPLREPFKVPSMDEGRSPQSSPHNALRVKQIVPSSPHRLSSPPISVPSRLPPLETSSIPSHRKLVHRASSAIDNKEGRKHAGRERNVINTEVSRPSTTQAFRSDMLFGAHNLRSSTPMVQSIPARQLYTMGGHSGGLNVMGNGLYPSAAEPSPHGLEDQEGTPIDRHSQWIPSHSSFGVYKPRRTLRN